MIVSACHAYTTWAVVEQATERIKDCQMALISRVAASSMACCTAPFARRSSVLHDASRHTAIIDLAL